MTDKLKPTDKVNAALNENNIGAVESESSQFDNLKAAQTDNHNDIISAESESGQSDNLESVQDKTVAAVAPPREDSACKFNKAKDDKIKKFFSYGSIPFFLGGAILAMFKIDGKARNPYSFLIVVIAIALFSIPYLIRYVNLKKCSCPVCADHRKITLQFFLMLMVALLVFLGVFIYLIVI